MAIDMAQFHQVFFEESFEGLDVMESGLLNLDLGDVDSETINTIFRAAHSIKGGSGTFGFTAVSEFTHSMETLLDEMRDGRRQVTQAVVNVLLEAVDCLREMLAAIQQEQAIDEAAVAEHRKKLEDELAGRGATTPTVTEQPASPVDNTGCLADEWKILFRPTADMLMTGNDPVRMFRELNELGELTPQIDLQQLPDIHMLEPESCYLSWNLTLAGGVDKNQIDEVFAWVEDECELVIQGGPVSSATEKTASLIGEDSPQQKLKQQPSPDTIAVPEKHTQAIKQKPAMSPQVASIRVDTDKIDTLINMVGELVITQSMLSLIGIQFDPSRQDQLKQGLMQLEQQMRLLQEGVMNIRMLPISFVFNRFPRLVHDISQQLGKKIDLVLKGEHTEVDKTVVEMLADPLVHLVRNSLDHGIELPAERIAAGKPETGQVMLNAYHHGGNIVIEVKDDGRGLDKDKLRAKAIDKGLIDKEAILTDQQIFELIFLPGFSTAEKLTDISGRGVGMDVVRKNIQALGGNITIQSEPGQGSSIFIHLPLTLAILDGQAIAVGEERYIVPLGAIIETMNIADKQVNRVIGQGETFKLHDEYIPIVRMHTIFNIARPRAKQLADGLVVVVEDRGIKCGLFIDELLGQQQVVIKSLEANYRKIDGVSGATILGDGMVALILDIPGLVRLARRH